MASKTAQANTPSPNLSQRERKIPAGWREVCPPQNWRRVKLGEVADDITYGYTASANNNKIGPKFLRITDIVPDRINWINVPYCEISDKDKVKYQLKIGDIVIARTGATTGYNKIIKEKYDSVFASYLIRYRINTKVAHPFYIGYVLLSPKWKGFIDGVKGGSAQPGANAKQLASFQFLLPPLPEQKAIAEVLSSLDDKIDLLHRQNKTLEDMAQVLFRKWFVDEADEGWKEVRLGEVLDIKLGGTPSTTKSEYWNGDIPWINSGEINKFRIFEPTKYITQLGLEKSATKLLPKGTTVIAITGATLGQISLLEFDCCANQSVVGVIPNEILPREFVYLWIKKTIAELISNQTGGAQQHINKNDVNNALIVIPAKEKLGKNIPTLKNLFDKISVNISQIHTLENMRDTLLSKLMSGEVRVKF